MLKNYIILVHNRNYKQESGKEITILYVRTSNNLQSSQKTLVKAPLSLNQTFRSSIIVALKLFDINNLTTNKQLLFI